MVSDLKGGTNLTPLCPYLKTVGSGIPGSAPRLKPVNEKKKKKKLKDTGLNFRIAPRKADSNPSIGTKCGLWG